MKILQVIPYFSFARGGDVNVCYNLSKQLTMQNHEVTILTTRFDYDKEDTDLIDNLKMVPVDYKFNLALFIYSPLMKKWLDENIKKYDIIHLHELRSYQNNIVIEYAKKYNIPYILQPHASTPKHISKSFIKEIYDKAYGNRIMKNASCVIAVSNEEAYYDKQMNAKDVRVIYNGMDLDLFKEKPIKNSFKEKYSIDGPYILYLGRLDKLKGIDYLIKAFSKFSNRYDNYKLVIVGKINSYKEELDKIVIEHDLEDKVIFTGYIEEEDKLSAYYDAELFVNAVKYMGGVSITVFESILMDTPVIVTKESGELVEQINAGIIVEYADVNELFEAMAQSIENPKLSKKYLDNGQAYIYENLSWSVVSNRILDIYKEFVGE